MPDEPVVITGGTGFLASYVIRQALDDGFKVRTTVESAEQAAAVHALAGDRPVEVVVADLAADGGWAEAMAGAKYVLHVAAPFAGAPPTRESELLVPTRGGALRVLAGARGAGVRRVVLASSFGAIGFGHRASDQAFTEETWTDLTSPDVSVYNRVQTLAERAAWDFVAGEDAAPELVVLNATNVLGPALGQEYPSSLSLLQRMLAGTMRSLPDIWTTPVDVRDLARLYLTAMTSPDAAGRRFIAAGDEVMSLPQIAALLRNELGAAAAAVPTKMMSPVVMRVLGLLYRRARGAANEVGVIRRASNEAAKRTFGWAPRSSQETVLDAARSLVTASVTAERI